MTESLRILWVHDTFDGPVNGLALYENEKVWFSWKDDITGGSVPPSVVSSTDVPVNDVKEIRQYNLTKLSSDLLAKIEENHAQFCQATGASLYHGDPMKVKRRSQVTKIDLKSVIPPGEDGVDVSKRPLTNITSFTHSYDPSDISGEIIAVVTEADFTNYTIPRTIEME